MPVYPGRSSFRSDTAVETAVFCQAEGASCHGQRNLWHRLQYSDRSRRNQPCPYASLSGRRRICKKAARLLGLRLTVLKEDPSAITLLLSCSSMPTGDFRPACGLLKQVIDSFNLSGCRSCKAGHCRYRLQYCFLPYVPGPQYKALLTP